LDNFGRGFGWNGGRGWTGDWKVPRTRRLESLRYRGEGFVTRFGVTDYRVARQRDPTVIGVGAAIAGAVAIAVHEVFGVSVAVVGVAAVLFVKFFIAEDFIQGVFRIGGVAFGAGFAAIAFGVVDDFDGVVGWFGVVWGFAVRLGAIGCN